MWEQSFVPVTVLLGAELEDALAALPEASVVRLGDLPARLRGTRRARAQVLATAAQQVALALGEVTLR